MNTVRGAPVIRGILPLTWCVAVGALALLYLSPASSPLWGGLVRNLPSFPLSALLIVGPLTLLSSSFGLPSRKEALVATGVGVAALGVLMVVATAAGPSRVGWVFAASVLAVCPAAIFLFYRLMARSAR